MNQIVETRPRLTDVANEVGITFRQADFWVRQGYVATTRSDQTTPTAGHAPGSGCVRELDSKEESVLRAMADLVHAGFKAADAAKLARQIVEENRKVRVGKSLVISKVHEVSS